MKQGRKKLEGARALDLSRLSSGKLRPGAVFLFNVSSAAAFSADK
jgi:hypothetical protein